jgi:DNA repair protein RecN (Recombination protein N)
MHMLGKSAQVFSVTHLGQVAACAKIHYFVSKSQGTDTTNTLIERLDTQNRIRELSLISSGTLSETSLSAASEMLEENQRIVGLL